MLFLYRLFYFISFLFYIPRFLYGMAFKKKWRKSFLKRLFPQPLPDLREPLIWLHAVSVGEVVAAAPLIAKIHETYPLKPIVISTITETGFATAHRLFPKEYLHCYLPFDFLFSLRRLLGKNTLSLVLLSEGDIWPLFLDEAKKRGAKIAIINGKLSEKSFNRLHRFDRFSRFLFSFIDLFCFQHSIFQKRVEALGIDGSCMHVTGTTKADALFHPLDPLEKGALCQRLGIDTSCRVIVLASTHSPEEKELYLRLRHLVPSHPNLKFIIIPRHPERAHEVMNALSETQDPLVLYSSREKEKRWQCLIVDALGMVQDLYQISTLAIVCGSFTNRVGGHNIIEPAQAGVPFIVGPHMHAQPTLLLTAREEGAVIEATYEDITEKVDSLLKNPDKLKEAQERARAWAEKLQGGSERTFRVLKNERFLP